jgi:hypothetical protein
MNGLGTAVKNQLKNVRRKPIDSSHVLGSFLSLLYNFGVSMYISNANIVVFPFVVLGLKLRVPLFILVTLGFELRALCLLARCSTAL